MKGLHANQNAQHDKHQYSTKTIKKENSDERIRNLFEMEQPLYL